MIVNLQEIVFEIITQELSLPSATFSLETPLEDLGVDSMKAITILYELENRLDIEIPNDVFDSIRNVSDIVQQLQLLTIRRDTARLGE